MIRLVGCFNIKTGDKIECEKANFYGDFLFVVEGKYYHTYRIHNKKVSGDLTIVECNDRRFYFKEEFDDEDTQPISIYNPKDYKEGTEIMFYGYSSSEDCLVQEVFIIHHNDCCTYYENEDGYKVNNLDETQLGYKVLSFRICE